MLKVAYDGFCDYENGLTRTLIEGFAGIPSVTIHGITNNNRIAERVPTVSFTHEKPAPEFIASAMAKSGIFV